MIIPACVYPCDQNTVPAQGTAHNIWSANTVQFCSCTSVPSDFSCPKIPVTSTVSGSLLLRMYKWTQLLIEWKFKHSLAFQANLWGNKNVHSLTFYEVTFFHPFCLFANKTAGRTKHWSQRFKFKYFYLRKLNTKTSQLFSLYFSSEA